MKVKERLFRKEKERTKDGEKDPGYLADAVVLRLPFFVSGVRFASS